MCSGSWRTCRSIAPASAADRACRSRPTCIAVQWWNSWRRGPCWQTGAPLVSNLSAPRPTTDIRIGGAIVLLRTIERIRIAIGETAGGRGLALLVGVEAAIADRAIVLIALDAERIVPGLRG